MSNKRNRKYECPHDNLTFLFVNNEFDLEYPDTDGYAFVCGRCYDWAESKNQPVKHSCLEEIRNCPHQFRSGNLHDTEKLPALCYSQFHIQPEWDKVNYCDRCMLAVIYKELTPNLCGICSYEGHSCECWETYFAGQPKTVGLAQLIKDKLTVNERKVLLDNIHNLLDTPPQKKRKSQYSNTNGSSLVLQSGQ
jgi:hypothetical protein